MTPLYLAAGQGHEQIVQILLEKGKPNVDLAAKVILLLLLLYFNLLEMKNGLNSYFQNKIN